MTEARSALIKPSYFPLNEITKRLVQRSVATSILAIMPCAFVDASINSGSSDKNIVRKIPVKAHDTLWDISADLSQTYGISIYQSLLGLSQLNPHAFLNDNIHLLRKDVSLNIPTKNYLVTIDLTTAMAFAKKTDDDYRRALQPEILSYLPEKNTIIKKQNIKLELINKHKERVQIEKRIEDNNIPYIGRVASIKGNPQAQMLNAPQFNLPTHRSLIKSSAIFPQDVIITDNNSEVVIKLKDNSQIYIHPLSRITLEQAINASENSDTSSNDAFSSTDSSLSIILSQGGVRSLNKTKSTSAPLTVKTPHASIKAVNNHFDAYLSSTSDSLNITLWQGELQTDPPISPEGTSSLNAKQAEKFASFQGNQWQLKSEPHEFLPPPIVAQSKVNFDELDVDSSYFDSAKLESLELEELQPLLEGDQINIASTDPTRVLESLVKEKQFEEAYYWSKEIALEWEGDPNFDFWQGLSSAETGHFDEAIFTFERILMSSDEQLRVNLELARTHFLANNLEAAKREFEYVLKQNPPKNVKVNIRKFLDLIALRQRSMKPKFFSLVQGNMGYDTNINSATTDDFVTLPGVGNITIPLSDDSQETGSLFFDIASISSYQHPLTKLTTLDILFSAQHKQNLENDNFDLDILGLEAGYSYQSSSSTKWRFAGKYQQIWLSYEGLQNSITGTAQWLKKTLNKYQLALSSQYTLNSSDTNSANDNNQLQVSLTASKEWAPFRHTLSGVFGTDSYDADINKHSGKNSFNLSYNLRYKASAKKTYTGTFATNMAKYKDDQPLFLVERDDSAYSLTGGWQYQLTPKWLIKSDLSYSVTDSNISLYSYNRTKIQAGFRYSFK